LVSCDPADTDPLLELAAKQGVQAARIGSTGGDRLDFGVSSLSLGAARDAFENALGDALSATMA
jgi:hypothetical protein